MKTLQSAVIKTEPIDWRSLQFLQEENFKDLSDTSKQKLKTSLLTNQFSQPFYVWQDPKTEVVYCLDGKHRSTVLEEFIIEGINVPEKLPATFINCKNKKEASALVLQYSSIYARVTQQGLFDFMEAFELNFDELTTQIDLPDFSVPRFEQKFERFEAEDTEDTSSIEIKDKELVVKQGDLFILNHHRILCSSFEDKDSVNTLMQNEKARIINCDPPYNISIDKCIHRGKVKHETFISAGGEMSDEEFVTFLSAVMQQSINHSIQGAIHYMFMDFRHIWHITEAARSIYKSMEPKQVCIWYKDMMANGDFYRSQYELCFIFKNGNKQKHVSHIGLGERTRTNVWQYPSAVSFSNPDKIELQNHPTPKPVAMIADTILDTTHKGDIVIDWFLGSGTCLIACEQTGRKGRFTEIEPKYVQSAIIRYINYCNRHHIPLQFTHANGNLRIEDFL